MASERERLKLGRAGFVDEEGVVCTVMMGTGMGNISGRPVGRRRARDEMDPPDTPTMSFRCATRMAMVRRILWPAWMWSNEPVRQSRPGLSGQDRADGWSSDGELDRRRALTAERDDRICRRESLVRGCRCLFWCVSLGRDGRIRQSEGLVREGRERRRERCVVWRFAQEILISTLYRHGRVQE